MFLKIDILKNFANLTKTHMLASLFNKIAGLFLKNTSVANFVGFWLKPWFFSSLFCTLQQLSPKKLAFMISLFWETSREIYWIITKWLFLFILFSIHFRKFQFFDDTSSYSYGQILPRNGEGNQAWEVYHEDRQYSCN